MRPSLPDVLRLTVLTWRATWGTLTGRWLSDSRQSILPSRKKREEKSKTGKSETKTQRRREKERKSVRKSARDRGEKERKKKRVRQLLRKREK